MKVVLFSEGPAGKTTFLSQFLRKDTVNTNTTIGAEVYKYGNFYFWDTAGIEYYGGLRDGYFIGADIGLLFAINTKGLADKCKDYIRVTSKKPIIIIIKNFSTETDKIIEFSNKYNFEYKEIDNLNKSDIIRFLNTL